MTVTAPSAFVILKKFREYFNGHEYAKQQCRKEGIAFTALDNAFGTVSDAAAVQRICDGLTDQKIYRFAGKWRSGLPGGGLAPATWASPGMMTRLVRRVKNRAVDRPSAVSW